MKYKAGDKVRIRSKEWYDEYKDEHGEIRGAFFDKECAKLCGSIQTIASGTSLGSGTIIYSIEASYKFIGEEAIEGLVGEEPTVFNGKEFLLRLANIESLSGTTTIWECPDGYQFVDENGNVINATKIVLEKKKKDYPKTYEECCVALEYIPHTDDIIGYKWDILQSLQKLLICRDAYWKIAGEEMGLGKPWKPDWNDDVWPDMYYISFDGKHIDKEKGYPCCNMILIFPTEEMRDAFYENFKEEIEQCKELL